MAHSVRESCANSPTDKKSGSCQPQLPSTARSLRLQNQQQGFDAQSCQQIDPVSSIDNPIADDFARTRSPLSIDQTDGAAKYCYPYVEDCDDEDSDIYNPPSPRISPFAADFMSANSGSPVFSRRKAASPLQQMEATVDAAESRVESQQQPVLPKDEDLAPENTPVDGPPDPTTHEEDPTNQGLAEEMSEDVHANNERPETNEFITSADLPEEKDTMESVIPGILTILDEEIDQQFADKGYIPLEPDSTDSSSLTTFVLDVFGEPQPPRNPDLCKAFEGSVNDSITAQVEDPSHTRLSEIGQVQLLINQALQDFKIDFLQQIESVINQSIVPLIPAKNSAAATILARSLPQLGRVTNDDISNAQEEFMSKIDSSKAEAIGYTLRIAEAIKAHSTETADALKKGLVEHIDHRLENLEKMFMALKTESSAQNEAYLEKIATELLPSEILTTLKKLPELMEQAKTLAITNAKEVSSKLEEYAVKAEAVSNLCTKLDETIASNQHVQNEIISNLCNILNQSTLQNNAINDLATIVNPVAKLVRGISYDTNLIDAKLAKNADILTSVTDRTEALEKAAAKFGKVILDTECRFQTATTKMDQVAKIASSVNSSNIVERFEALQGQMMTMQAQLDRIVATVVKQNPVNIHGTDNLSDSPPLTPTEHTSDRSESASEPASDTSSTQVEAPNSLPEPPAFTIDASFQLPSSKILRLPHPTTIPISESSMVFTILSNFRSSWTQELLKQGVTTAKMELVSIWVSSANSTSRRVVDNDTTYRGWYKVVTAGHARGGQLLHFEFLDCAKENGSGTEEPKSKKRKQEVMRRGSRAGVEFSLDVWRNARQVRYEKPSENKDNE